MHLLYFELFSSELNRGVIGVAESSDLQSWRYHGIALKESFHLSYPCVFEHNDELYMLPETLDAGEMCLYRAKDIDQFEMIRSFLPGQWADSTMLYHEGLFWIFTCSNPTDNGEMCIFYSDSIYGEWIGHPSNPVFSNSPHKARQAGKFFYYNGSLYRVAQDCSERYGFAVNCFKVLELDRHEYLEQPYSVDGPLLIDGNDCEWASFGVHHIDVIESGGGGKNWLFLVDGSSLHEFVSLKDNGT